jgi:hypothetical protein
MGADSVGIKALYQFLQENKRKVPKLFAKLFARGLIDYEKVTKLGF